jgi:hypothetical protein
LGWGEEILHEFGGVNGTNSGEVGNLLPARCPACDKHVARSQGAGGGQQSPLAYRL